MKSEERSSREFAFVVVALLSLIGAVPLLHSRAPRWIFLGGAAVVLAMGLFFPRTFTIPARWWMLLADLLNRASSAIILAVVYLVVITPIGMYKRLAKKDALQRTLDRRAPTYWSDREEPNPRVDTLRRQY